MFDKYDKLKYTYKIEEKDTEYPPKQTEWLGEYPIGNNLGGTEMILPRMIKVQLQKKNIQAGRKNAKTET